MITFIIYASIVISIKGRYENMNGSQVIKQLMIESGIDIKQLAVLLEINPQSVRNKLSRNSFSLADFEKIINMLGGELQVISNRTKNVYH